MLLHEHEDILQNLRYQQGRRNRRKRGPEMAVFSPVAKETSNWAHNVQPVMALIPAVVHVQSPPGAANGKS